jgi:hypothetical protein
MEVKKILIPNKPHLDPIAAVYLLSQYGQNQFSGINDAKIIFWEEARDPTNEEIKKFSDNGVLLIDVGGSIFDHHDKDEGGQETTTELVASYLGVDKNPELSALLAYIREDDLAGLHNRYGDLAYLVKSMYKQGIASNDVVSSALGILHYLQVAQYEWHHNVKKEYEEKKKEKIIKRNRNKLKVIIIESDNLQVANYGITQDNAAVVIQKRSSGHVMVLTNKFYRVDLREIVAAIRKKELELSGYNKEIDTEKLKFEGKNMLVPNWFYHRALNSILNGSDSLNKTEATKIDFNDIVRFVLYGISTEDSELCDCQVGGNSCPYVAYGFSKCRNKRY